MDTRQTSLFILIILFHLTNVISGASLGKVELLNETLENAEEEHRTVLQNIQKNYYSDEFRNFEMKDIENYFNGFMTPGKKDKKPIHTSKTYFGSAQSSGPHIKSRGNSQHQTWDRFKANSVIGSQPLYFDVSDDLLQQYIYSKNHESSYSKTGDENSSDFPEGVEDLWEDMFPLSEITSTNSMDELSEHAGFDVTNEEQVDELQESTGVSATDDQVDEFSEEKGVSITDEDKMDELSEETGVSVTDEDKMDKLSEETGVSVTDDQVDELFEQRGLGVGDEDPDLGKTDKDEFQGSGDMDDSLGEALTGTGLDSKSGRIIDFFPRDNNAAECTTPKGERGRCRSLTQCPMSEPLNNFNLFLKYVCISRGVLVGICCPDNPVVEISDPSENSTGTSLTEFKQPIDGCGANSNTRIVGGKVSLPHEWTWMVALMRRNRFFCGGVIINDWYILTAAHCVMGVKLQDLKVRLGEYNFNEKNEHQEDISVAEIKRHALFVTLTFQHDIALLKLKRSIKYSKFIGSICLPNPKSGNFSNVNATVVGWGTVAFGGSASPVLRQVTVPVWDNDECDKTYRLERITNAFMCAGSPENGEDACQGDSGGPLMALNEEDRWEVIGIVSWGRRCGDPTFPGVYTRVTSYLDWISENAN